MSLFTKSFKFYSCIKNVVIFLQVKLLLSLWLSLLLRFICKKIVIFLPHLYNLEAFTDKFYLCGTFKYAKYNYNHNHLQKHPQHLFWLLYVTTGVVDCSRFERRISSLRTIFHICIPLPLFEYSHRRHIER